MSGIYFVLAVFTILTNTTPDGSLLNIKRMNAGVNYIGPFYSKEECQETLGSLSRMLGSKEGNHDLLVLRGRGKKNKGKFKIVFLKCKLNRIDVNEREA